MGMAVFFTKIGAGLDLLMGNLGTPGLGKILNLFIYTWIYAKVTQGWGWSSERLDKLDVRLFSLPTSQVQGRLEILSYKNSF